MEYDSIDDVMIKYYKISEEELIRILDYAFGHVTEIENYVKDVLKSKKPIEPLNRDRILVELKEFFKETGLIVSVEQDQLEDLADTISYLSPQPEPSKDIEEDLKQYKILQEAYKLEVKKHRQLMIDHTNLRVKLSKLNIAKPSGEVIAEGVVRYTQSIGWMIDDKEIPKICQHITNKLEGTKVKLIIHKCKESK